MDYDSILLEALKLPQPERTRLAEALRGSVNGAPAGEEAENEPSVYDLMRRHGLLIDEDPDCPLPSDLSTNPKYMEGFGRE